MFLEKEKGLNTALRNSMDKLKKKIQSVRLVIYLWNTNTKIALILKINFKKIKCRRK